ncbi:hypothetical protein ACFCW2_04425 [Qipengyuania sp. DSG2-2]|uniref:hypothetical protein n=1 Tax=Qipengyuania sp. DGS2-2 TaxID=3349631 RepID=UPI0036D3CF71
MKFTSKTAMVATAAALSLGLAACDGANEEAMEDAGEEMVEATEAEADAMEEAGEITGDEADAMVDEAEDTADAMEEEGETMDEAAS